MQFLTWENNPYCSIVVFYLLFASFHPFAVSNQSYFTNQLSSRALFAANPIKK
jgi:hypothetical protein